MYMVRTRFIISWASARSWAFLSLCRRIRPNLIATDDIEYEDIQTTKGSGIILANNGFVAKKINFWACGKNHM